MTILNTQKKALDQHSERLARYKNEYKKLLQKMQKPSNTTLFVDKIIQESKK